MLFSAFHTPKAQKRRLQFVKYLSHNKLGDEKAPILHRFKTENCKSKNGLI